MATVTSSLKLYDAMTQPLRGIIQSMNLMLSTMHQMQAAAGENEAVSKSLAVTKAAVVSAEVGLKAAIEETTAAQLRMNEVAEKQPTPKMPLPLPVTAQPHMMEPLAAQQPAVKSKMPIWETQNALTVFQSTGLERLLNEMNSAKSLMGELTAAKERMTGADMKFLPAEALQDIEVMNQRAGRLGELLQQAELSKKQLTAKAPPEAFSALNASIENIRGDLNEAVQAQNRLNQAMQAGDLSGVNSAYQQLNQAVRSTELEIRNNVAEQDKFNRSLESGNVAASSLWNRLRGIGALYLSFQGAKAGIDTSDEYINTQARINLINDGLQTTLQLQDKIFAAARDARGNYSDMAAAVGKMGLLAGDAFKGNNELIAFTDLMQKSFRIGGASTTEQQAGMYQLTQSMASGKLQGDEFRSIMENAPMLAQAIANFTGKSKGDLKSMSAQGTITADIIKGAMFSAADSINQKFASMPQTFGDKWNQMKNSALQSFGPVIEKVNRFLNSPGGTTFFNTFLGGITLTAKALGWLVNGLMWIGNVMSDNWGIIEPILVIAIGMFTLWALTQLRYIPLIAGKLWLMLQPILAQVAAWLVLNWPILLIGAAIGFLIYSLYKWEDATATVVGFVGGIIGTLVAFFFNKFAMFANMILSVAEFFVNVWRDPIYAVKKLFYDLVIESLQHLSGLATGVEKIINSIPGLHVNITSGLDNLLSKLEEARSDLKSDKDVVTLKRFTQMDYGDAFNRGRDIGESVSHFASDKIQGAIGAMGSMFKAPGLPGTDTSNFANATLGRVNEVGKINDTVDISSEDLKMMRELAEMKNIQNFVSLTPTVQVIHTGDIRQDSDIQTIVAGIKTVMEQEIASSTRVAWGVE